MNRSLPISEIMTVPVVTILETDTVDRAKELLADGNFHHLPVFGTDGLIKGIISTNDFPNAVKNGLTEIWQIMTPESTKLHKDDAISVAADIFLSNSFHAIPIMDEDTLVGILTTHDLLKYAFKDAL